MRVIFRRAIRDGLAVVNPCTGIDLPANRSARVEIVSPEHAARLIEALEDGRDRGTLGDRVLRRPPTRRTHGAPLARRRPRRRRRSTSSAATTLRTGSSSIRSREPDGGASRSPPCSERTCSRLRSARADPTPTRSCSATATTTPFDYDAVIARAREARGEGRARPDRAPRGPAHRRVADDRRRREREGAERVPRATRPSRSRSTATATCCPARSPKRRRSSTPTLTRTGGRTGGLADKALQIAVSRRS